MHPRGHRIFNVDVYLDAAVPGEGALRVVPGSQGTKVDVCEHGWDIPGAVEVAMVPGDVLVHDVMLVHVTGSGSTAVCGCSRWRWPSTARPTRRRLRLPGAPIPICGPNPAGDAATELRIAHLVHTPGSYCSAGSVPATSATAL